MEKQTTKLKTTHDPHDHCCCYLLNFSMEAFKKRICLLSRHKWMLMIYIWSWPPPPPWPSHLPQSVFCINVKHIPLLVAETTGLSPTGTLKAQRAKSSRPNSTWNLLPLTQTKEQRISQGIPSTLLIQHLPMEHSLDHHTPSVYWKVCFKVLLQGFDSS